MALASAKKRAAALTDSMKQRRAAVRAAVAMGAMRWKRAAVIRLAATVDHKQETDKTALPVSAWRGAPPRAWGLV